MNKCVLPCTPPLPTLALPQAAPLVARNAAFSPRFLTYFLEAGRVNAEERPQA